jgi:NitT/TauT family transport system substrate-binding protein
MEQFPGLASQMDPAVATESMLELANVFGGRMDERKKWGYHLPSSWELFFATGKKIGQITQDIKFEEVCKNDLSDEANAFDAAKVKKDADGFQLSDAYKAVDAAKIQSAL